MALRISIPAVSPEKVLIDNLKMDASKVVYVRADCNKYTPATNLVDWRVKSNKAATILAYRSFTNDLSATITLADATAVDDTDTFLLNGVTLTAEDTEVEAIGTKYYSGGADETVTATALAACINANVPGILATAAARVITLVPSATPALPFGAPAILFQQGTSAANEIAFADTTLSKLRKDNSFTSVTGADNSTTAGTIYKQFADGYPFCYLGYTDTSAAETTFTIGATLHDYA
jgi:hypothetical protein